MIFNKELAYTDIQQIYHSFNINVIANDWKYLGYYEQIGTNSNPIKKRYIAKERELYKNTPGNHYFNGFPEYKNKLGKSLREKIFGDNDHMFNNAWFLKSNRNSIPNQEIKISIPKNKNFKVYLMSRVDDVEPSIIQEKQNIGGTDYVHKSWVPISYDGGKNSNYDYLNKNTYNFPQTEKLLINYTDTKFETLKKLFNNDKIPSSSMVASYTGFTRGHIDSKDLYNGTEIIRQLDIYELTSKNINFINFLDIDHTIVKDNTCIVHNNIIYSNNKASNGSSKLPTKSISTPISTNFTSSEFFNKSTFSGSLSRYNLDINDFKKTKIWFNTRWFSFN